MLQRIQTIYLFVSALLIIVCGCLPIGTFVPEGMGAMKEMYNLCLIDGSDGSWNFSVCGLFVMLAVAVVITVMNIFSYSNLKLQMRNCSATIIVLLLWIVLYALQATVLSPEQTEFKFGFVAVLPLIAIIFQWLARRAINSDYNLLKSVDRIR